MIRGKFDEPPCVVADQGVGLDGIVCEHRHVGSFGQRTEPLVAAATCRTTVDGGQDTIDNIAIVQPGKPLDEIDS